MKYLRVSLYLTTISLLLLTTSLTVYGEIIKVKVGINGLV